jgi:hypothetical protein
MVFAFKKLNPNKSKKLRGRAILNQSARAKYINPSIISSSIRNFPDETQGIPSNNLILEKYMLKVTSGLSAISAGGLAFFWNQHL